MRKILMVGMMGLFILTIITGIGESSPRHTGPAVAHILMVVLFIVLVLAHAWLNRKAFRRYFAGTARPEKPPTLN
jgi:Kef-type K+ transport system membrane component KefB